MNFSTLIQKAFPFWPRIFRRDLAVADPAASKHWYFPLMWTILGLCLVSCASTPTISSVKVNANPLSLESGASASLSAVVSGTGAFNKEVNWSIVSGGGELSASSGATINYTAKGVAAGTEVVVKATSVGSSSKSDSATLQVVAPKPKIASFSATPDLLGGGGGNLDLAWEVSGADSLSIDQGIGVVSGTSKEVLVQKDITFTLTATNTAGSTTATKTVRLTALGNQDWKKQLGSAQSDNAFGVATDTDGNVIIVGDTRGALLADNAGDWDAFVVKYDPKGNELWKKQIGTVAGEGAFGVATDSSGNVFVSGYTSGALFGDNAGGLDIFLVKYDPSGNLIWKKQFGSSGADNQAGLVSDQGGNVYVVGWTQGALFANFLGEYDAFVVKYDPSGNVVWKKQFGTTGDDEANRVAVDGSGNVIVAGETTGTIAGDNAGDYDAFLVKYDAGGKELWKKQFGAGKYDSPRGIATDSSGYILVGGVATNNTGDEDVLVAKYSPEGSEIWKKQLDTGKEERAYGLATDSSGNVFVAGYTSGAFTGNNLGLSDIFVLKYDPSGGELWKKQFGTDQNETALGIAADSSGNVFMIGGTQGSLFGTSASLGNPDVFVVRYR